MVVKMPRLTGIRCGAKNGLGAAGDGFELLLHLRAVAVIADRVWASRC